MHEHDQLNDDERGLEAALTRLTPVGPTGMGIDRDGLMFAAGRAAARRELWRWRALTGVFAAGLAAMSIMNITELADRRSPVADWGLPSRRSLVAATIAPIPPALPAPPVPPVPPVSPVSPDDPRPDQRPIRAWPASYLALRRLVIEHGVDALPQDTSLADTPAPHPRDLLDEIHG